MATKEPKPNDFARVLSDLPLDRKEDLHFQFDGIARSLAELAWNPDNESPFTVVIKAGWGRGKTTLMRQIERHFREREAQRTADREGAGDPSRRVEPLWLNVWKYPDDEKILAGLAGKLIDKFQQSQDLTKQLASLVDQHKAGLGRAVLRAAAPWLPGLGEDDSGGRYDPVFERRAFYDTFEHLFLQLLYLWWHAGRAWRDNTQVPARREQQREEQKKHVLAVFLDDLDRCTEKRALEVLEAIYLFQDLPGVCFYLGLDWDRLKQLVPQRFPERERFLEKIVQLSYDIPDVSVEGARDYVSGLVAASSLGARLGHEGDRRLHELASSLRIRHPRHLKRFLNDLSMSLAVLGNTGLLRLESEERTGRGQAEERAAVAPEAVAPEGVLAYQAMKWILPEEEYRRLKSPAGLGDLLEKIAAAEEGSETVSAEARTLHSQQKWLVLCLSNLAREQRETLVHFGSPRAQPEMEEEPAAKPADSAAVREHRAWKPVKLRIPDLREIEGDGWVGIEGGAFEMGDETLEHAQPIHRVTLHGFRIAKYPVTNRAWRTFLDELGLEQELEPPRHWEGGEIPEGFDDHPVVHVSWDDAQAYCQWLSAAAYGREGRAALLSEAQWEFVARGPKGRTYPWGEEEPNQDLANFGRNVGGTTPVDRYPSGATSDGVFDLAGNIWEWVEDDSHPSYEGAPDDGSAWIDDPRGEVRVLRGGSFYYVPKTLRAAYRYKTGPQVRVNVIGFRVVWLCSGGQE